MDESCSKRLESKEMCIEPPASDLVSARFGNGGFAKASKQRTNHQYAATQSGTFSYDFIALQILEAEVIGLECVVAFSVFPDFHACFLEQKDKVVNVEDIRDIVDTYLVGGKQAGADDLQSFIFRALRGNGAFE